MGFIYGAAGEEWARRVRRLGAQERERRLEAVNVLLGQPEDLCAPLESELYILRAQLLDDPAEVAFAEMLADIQSATPAEQAVISAARAARDRCMCGDDCEDGAGILPYAAVRMRAYLEANPGREFAWDEEAGIVAVIIPRPPGDPEVVAWSDDLAALLDQVGAPRAVNPS